jgi:hypothetical protein
MSALKILSAKGGVKHQKANFRKGLNVASTSLPGFVAGSNVRIKHRK